MVTPKWKCAHCGGEHSQDVSVCPKKPHNLYEAVKSTEPGKHACAIGDVLYDMGVDFRSTDRAKQLSAVQHYLEGLAHVELEARLAKEMPWASELLNEARDA